MRYKARMPQHMQLSPYVDDGGVEDVNHQPAEGVGAHQHLLHSSVTGFLQHARAKALQIHAINLQGSRHYCCRLAH